MFNIAIDRSLNMLFDAPNDGSVDFFSSVDLDEILNKAEHDYLVSSSQGSPVLYELLVLSRNNNKKIKYLTHQIDIETFIKQQGKSFPSSKKNLFSQAIGRKTQYVIDATGGWLGDSLLMISQNYQVDVIERNWLLQGFIKEACLRLSKTDWAKFNQAPIPQLRTANAVEYLQQMDIRADCIYIDPMFPPKIKKSAAVRKSMKVLHDIVGQDSDSEQLFEAAYKSDISRIVVKRPDYANPLGGDIIAPSETISGKLVRYDIYLR